MSRSSRALLLVLICAMVASAAPSWAAAGHMSFEEAKARSAERGVPIVVDFFTDWCIYCKHFDRDYAEGSSGIALALSEVVFTSIDAEKGEGIELARNYGVQGFPTYIVIDAAGELIDRWSGYGGPAHFLGALESALEEPITVVARRERYASAPTAGDAQVLARMADGEGKHLEAIALLERAVELDASLDLSSELLVAAYYGLRAKQLTEDDFVARAEQGALTEGARIDMVLMAHSMVENVTSREGGDPSRALPFLERAVAMIDADPGSVDDATRYRIASTKALRIDGDGERAAKIRKKLMPVGWTESAQDLNAYAWWCFENGVNLEEAEDLARRGAELAESGKVKAMVLDTTAEICNARGDCRDAVKLIEQAIAEDPSNQHYRQQLERFQKILAASE